MAKSVSTDFKEIWARKYGRKEILKVLYWRRYWNGSAYVWESGSGTEITQRDVPPLRAINWKLDTQNLNEILASNVTLRLNDLERKWLPVLASPSVFAPDDIATSGYEPYLTKFQIQFGYVLDDGTKEYTALFTGYAESYRFDGNSSVVEITVSGRERLLKDSDAEQISDTFTLESATEAADGSRTQFTTTSTGVGRISTVQVNGVTMTQGTDYSISGLNEVGKATVNFTVAPTSGHTVKFSGIKWKTNKKIEELIGLLCDEAGIGSSERTINPVIFPGSVSGRKTIDTQADWEAGTVLTSIDTTSFAGSIVKTMLVDSFTDGDFTANPAWTVNSGGGTVSSGILFTNAGNSQFYTARSHSGTPFVYRFLMAARSQSEQFVRCAFFSTTSDLSGNGYMMELEVSAANNRYVFRLIKITAGVQSTLVEQIYDGNIYSLTNAVGEINYTVIRDSNGLISVYVNSYRNGELGSFLFSTTDTAFTTSNYIVLDCTAPVVGALYDEIYHNNQVAAVFESAEQDIGSTPVAWGTLDRTETLNGGTITYATASAAASGGPYDAYVAIAADGTIQSSLKRYFKIRATISVASDSLTSPQVHKLVANFATTSVSLAIANFSGKTCFSAIQRLAQLADYEWGFTGAGNFFFRSKTVSGSPTVTIDQENAIASLTDYQLGYDRVFNVGRVRYGTEDEYVAVYGSSDASEASPTSEERFGSRIKDESHTDVVFANDATIGTARARLIRDNNHLPRIRCRAKCRMIPHVDLSDIARVTFLEKPRDRDNVLGDPLQTYGEAAFGAPLNVLLRDKDMKVIGVSYVFPQNEKQGFETDLELLEVLS